MGGINMVRLILQSKGLDLESALDCLKVEIGNKAKEMGLIVPEDRLSAVYNYQVGVRRQNGGRYHVATATTYQEAFENAVAFAGYRGGYDKEKHRLHVMANAEFKPVKGTPSGADRYSRVPKDLTNDLF